MTSKKEQHKLSPLKVESILPVKTVGIECLKESNPEKMSPHRFLYKWFARRPTAATRLAVLASVLPDDLTNDELLRLMQIGPDNQKLTNSNISEYVLEKWETKDNREGTVTEHFDYPTPHTQSPTIEELEQFHDILRKTWDGELPTIIDPTAGGGTIPLESLRYGLPTIANELNPVAWLINKVILEYANEVGSIREDVEKWADIIELKAQESLNEYFPSPSGQSPNHYLRTYSIECPSCGYRVPLADRWWFRKHSSNKGHAFRPHVSEDSTNFEYVELPTDVDKSEFDPDDGVVDSGDAECLNCGVVTEKEVVKQHFSEGKFQYEVCGVKYTDQRTGKNKYRAPTAADKEAIRSAKERINSDLNLRTLLNIKRDVGDTNNLRVSWSYAYGTEKWRDIYSPRQLLSHAMYLEAFEQSKNEIRKEYDSTRAEAILSILSLTSTKLIERNSRLNPIDLAYGSPANMLGSNNFAFQWVFGESNLCTGTYSFDSSLDVVLDGYENVTEYLEHTNQEATILNGDAADLPYENNSLQTVVIDPPYGDNIRYAELADAFYVWLREYLDDIYPNELASPLSNKQEEAIEDQARVEIPDNNNQSKEDLAREEYEEKMSEIFSEIYRVMESGGVLTIYFTEKEVSAWDSLTMSLINSGFTVTATHTVTSEMPQRVGMQKRASADSTLLLTCRKPIDQEESESSVPTLWSDTQERTREAAQKKANELFDSDLNLTKTDIIISAFGPTLRVFTEEYPIVDIHDEPVRPKEALEEARTAVTEILVQRELEGSLNEVDSLSTWYILSWLVYNRESIPYDDAHQLGLGVGVKIDEIKRDTKIWSKSGDKLILKGQDYRVQDYTKLESGNKRRKRAYPIDPRSTSFSHHVDSVHAAINVIETKGSDYTWNWLQERNLPKDPAFKRIIESLIQVLPRNHSDYESLINLVSGETGDLLDINKELIESNNENSNSGDGTTLSDFQ